MRAPKLDLADLHRHVAIEKDGFWRQLRFTPHDPEPFVAALDAALETWRARGEAPAGG